MKTYAYLPEILSWKKNDIYAFNNRQIMSMCTRDYVSEYKRQPIMMHDSSIGSNLYSISAKACETMGIPFPNQL